MARLASARIQGLVTVSGMVAFISAWSIAPRISVTRTEDATVIKYDHPKSGPSIPAPADPGLIITPAPKPPPTNRAQKPFSATDWIFDTGATTHVCSNRSLLHGYDTLNPYSKNTNPRAVGYFGPNPVPIVGAGDCTFTLPFLSSPREHTSLFNRTRESGPPTRVISRMTLRNVMHIPTAGVNLISWSQLKRAKGHDVRLVEERDGSLTVKDGEMPLMRFEPRDGLYFLVQATNDIQGRDGTQ